MSNPEGSNLYRRLVSVNGDDKFMKLWESTPWMLDIRVVDLDGFNALLDYVSSLPDGSVRTSPSPMQGWAWVGFSTRLDMRAFIRSWPPRAGMSEKIKGE